MEVFLPAVCEATASHEVPVCERSSPAVLPFLITNKHIEEGLEQERAHRMI